MRHRRSGRCRRARCRWRRSSARRQRGVHPTEPLRHRQPALELPAARESLVSEIFVSGAQAGNEVQRAVAPDGPRRFVQTGVGGMHAEAALRGSGVAGARTALRVVRATAPRCGHGARVSGQELATASVRGGSPHVRRRLWQGRSGKLPERQEMQAGAEGGAMHAVSGSGRSRSSAARGGSSPSPASCRPRPPGRGWAGHEDRLWAGAAEAVAVLPDGGVGELAVVAG